MFHKRIYLFLPVVFSALALALGAALLGTEPVAHAAALYTNVSGHITSDTTWTLANSPYILTGDVIVDSGVTLTIEPGVVVQGQSGTELRVEGHLNAVGTASQPITFTSATNSGPGQWDGLVFYGGTGNLEYVLVRYGGANTTSAGYKGNVIIRNVSSGQVRIANSEVREEHYGGTSMGDYGIRIVDSRVALSNTVIANNGNDTNVDYGLYATGSNVLTVTNCTFTNNSGVAVRVPAADVHGITGSAFAGNGYDEIRIDGGSVAVQSRMMPQTGLEAYVVWDGNLSVPSGFSLTLDPGTMLKINGYEVLVQGTLTATGTATSPITLTSYTDTGSGQWNGLVFNGGKGKLHHVTVRYGGRDRNSLGIRGDVAIGNGSEVEIVSSQVLNESYGGSVGDYGIYIANSQAFISDTLIANNGSDINVDYGLYATGSNTLAVTNCTFANNGGTAVRVPASDVHGITGNVFAGNGYDEIRIDGGSVAAQSRMMPQTGLDAYVVWSGNLVVPGSAGLTLDPGTMLKVNGYEVLVQGTLTATGTATSPITFTSYTDTGSGQWNGLHFSGYYDEGAGTLKHVTLRYAGTDGIEVGSDAGPVTIESSQVISNGQPGNTSYIISVYGRALISDTLVADNSGNDSGYAIYSPGVVTVTRTTIQNNAGRALFTVLGNLPAITENTFSGNGENRIRMGSGNFPAACTLTDQTGLESYQMEGDATVPNGGTLTIEPGVTLMGNGSSTSLWVKGHLEAAGTPAAPITFTSAADTGPGEWGGINLYGSSGNTGTAHLAYATVRYASASALDALDVTGEILIQHSQVISNASASYLDQAIYTRNSRIRLEDTLIAHNGDGTDGDSGAYFTNGSVVTITHTTVQNNAGDGIRVASSQVSLTCSSADHNAGDGLQVQAWSTVTAYSSGFYDNTGMGVNNTAGSDATVTATYNWWGAADGPSGEGPGSGDEVSSDVTYSPWMEQEACLANLSLTSMASPNPVEALAPLTYTHVLVNLGPGDAESVVLTDTLPAGVTFGSAASTQGTCQAAGGVLTCTLGSLTSGSGITITVTVTPTILGTLTNTVEANGIYDPIPADNSRTVAVTSVYNGANHTLQPPRSASAAPPGTVVYTHTLTNNGNVSQTFALTAVSSRGYTVSVEPAQTGSVPAFGCTVVTLTVQIPADAISGTQDTATLTAAGSVGGTASVQDVTTAAFNGAAPSLTPAAQSGAAIPGGQAVYTHTLTNNGNAAQTFALTAVSSQGYTVSVEPVQTGSVPAFGSTVITVRVAIPIGTPPDTQDTTTLTATASLGGAATASEHTTVLHVIYLPLTIR